MKKNVSDPDQFKKRLRLGQRIYASVRRVAPKLSEYRASKLCNDLGDLWTVGEEHKKHLRELSSLKSQSDRKRFERLLWKIYQNHLIHNAYHLASLRRAFFRIIDQLSPPTPKERKRAGRLRSKRGTVPHSRRVSHH